MLVCPSKTEIRSLVAGYRRARRTVALVPTMGYLHEGHLALVREAKRQAEKVIVSIFVNPTQFGPNEDLDSYPRDTDRDLALLEQEGVDGVFLPSPEEMYSTGGATFVEVPELSGMLQGALRPRHFRGVSTVVTKLFNIVQPDAAFFGEKDYQQLTLIRQMVRDLDMPIEIIAHPTVREEDGLALSSRNVRLSESHRQQAVVLSKALSAAESAAKTDPDIENLKNVIHETLNGAPDGKLESVDIRDAETLAEVAGHPARPVVVLLAVRFGSVLLIDQRVIANLLKVVDGNKGNQI